MTDKEQQPQAQQDQPDQQEQLAQIKEQLQPADTVKAKTDPYNFNEEVAAYLSGIRTPAIADTKNPFLVLPKNYLEVVDIEKHLLYPRKIRKNIHFIEAQSFVDYFKQFRVNFEPQIFATVDDSGMKFLCIFDYDISGKFREATAETPAAQRIAQPLWNCHLAKLSMAYHRDYANLRGHADKWISQEEFALFIEENAHLFVNPDAASMMELAQELKGNMSVSWQSGKRLSNGAVTMEYVQTIDAVSKRGQMEVPEYLDMKCPMYEGFDVKDIRAAFRWKINSDNKVLFSFRLLTKVAERAAQEEVKLKVQTDTQLPVLMVKEFETIAMDVKNIA